MKKNIKIKNYNFFDTHCHLNIDPLLSDAGKYANECEKNNILLCCVGVDIPTSLLAISQSIKYNNIICAVGIHPTEIDPKKYLTQINELEKIITTNKQFIHAIGEIGLDYHHKDVDIKIQKIVFEKILQMAIQFNKPFILHIRDAYDDAYKILAKYYHQASNYLVHCFDGDVDVVKKYNKLNCFYAIGGKVTYPQATKLQEAVKIIPKNRLLCETDSPFLIPLSKKSEKFNVPVNVIEIVDFINNLVNKNYTEQIFHNSLIFFNILFK